MNSNENLISIIVPVYKVEKYLDRCVTSILEQTYKQFEIILIDDESPDNCPKMCDEYAQQHENIVVVHLKNSGIGVSGARNAGIEAAKGKYITFIDSDDYVHKELLAVLKKGIESDPGVLISMCSYKRVSDSDKEPAQIQNAPVVQINDEQAMDMLLTDQARSAVWGKLYARDLFNDLRFPVGKHNEDMFIMPKIFQKAKKLAVSTEQLYYYYQDNESLCRSAFNYNMLDMIDAIAEWKEHVSINYPELTDKVNGHYFSSVLNSCQYLANKKDEYGMTRFKGFQNEIIKNYNQIVKSRYTAFSNKVKAILFKLGVFRFVIKTIEWTHIRKYE